MAISTGVGILIVFNKKAFALHSYTYSYRNHTGTWRWHVMKHVTGLKQRINSWSSNTGWNKIKIGWRNFMIQEYLTTK